MVSLVPNPNKPTSSNTGIVPIGVVEPLNILQKEGITRIAEGTPALGFRKGAANVFQEAQEQAGDLRSQMAQAFETSKAGAADITGDQIATARQTFSNPFQQQVIDRAIANVNRQESIRQAQLAREAQGSKAFGGGAQALQAGILGGEALRAIGDITANLEAQNFQQATNAALGLLGDQRARALQTAQTQGQIAGQGASINNALQNLVRTGLFGQQSNLQDTITRGQAEIAAGDIVQQQNQRLLDAIQRERFGVRSEPERQLQQALAVIQAFSGGGSGTPAVQGGSTLTNALGGAMLGSQLDFSNLGGLFGGA